MTNNEAKRPQPTGRGSGKPYLIVLPAGQFITAVSRTQCAVLLNKLCQIKTGDKKSYIDAGFVKSLFTMRMAIPEGPMLGTRVYEFEDEECLLRHILSDQPHLPPSINHQTLPTYHWEVKAEVESKAESEVKSKATSEVKSEVSINRRKTLASEYEYYKDCSEDDQDMAGWLSGLTDKESEYVMTL